MELELIEPALFMGYHESACENFYKDFNNTTPLKSARIRLVTIYLVLILPVFLCTAYGFK